MISVSLLGGLRIEAGENGKTVVETFPRRKVAALLALLALRPRQRHSREELAAQLWPDADTETGRRNLRQSLLYLRQVLPQQELVHADSHTLWLAEGTTTDTAAFEAAARSGDSVRARSLWRGELLPGFFEEALTNERERLNAVYAQLPSEGIPPPTVPRGLPLYLSELQGRETELETLSLLLADPGVRLVTLLGPGGVGKTRLSVAAASGMKHDVAFVELASLPQSSAEEQVLQSIGDALGFSSHREEHWEESLLRLIASRSRLLILDNAEHVLTVTSAVVLRLLRAAPRLKLLVTSREPLRLEGERTMTLPPLDSRIAARLLRSSARAIRADLPDDPESLARICEHLEGLPLALELAASLCRTLSLRELADDLQQGVGLGEPSSLSRPARQHSLEATLAWSEALLTPEQRTLLHRLAVFSGGAERSAILEICQARREALVALVEKSLVQTRIQPDGTTRYRFLEPIRQWALEQLTASGEHEPLKRAHAQYFLGFVERAAPELRRAEQHHWLKRLDREQANLHAASSQLEPEEGLRLVAALSDYWLRRGLLQSGLSLAEHYLAQSPSLPESEFRPAALLAQGALLLALGQKDKAQGFLKEAAGSQNRKVAIEATLHLSADMTQATYQTYQQALAPLQSELEDLSRWRWQRAQSLLLGERFLNKNGDHSLKIALATEAAQLFEEDGDLTKVMEALFSLVGIYLVQQRFDQAAPLLHRLQETAALLESTHLEVLALNMQIRSQRASTQPDFTTLASLASRLAQLAPRLAVPMEAYNAWHDLLQACRHLAHWQQAHHALGQMLHFRRGTVRAPLQGVYLLGAVGSFLADIGATERGGQLYGYMFGVRDALQFAPNALEQRVYERDLACLRAPDPAGLEKALAEGRLLTFEQAFTLAQQPIGLPAEGSAPYLAPI